MLRLRLITGPLLIALLLGLTWLDVYAAGVWATPLGIMLVVLSALFGALGGAELTALMQSATRGSTLSRLPGALGAAGMTVAIWCCSQEQGCASLVLLLIPLAAALIALFINALQRRCEGALAAAGAAVLSSIWVGAGLGMLLAMLHLAPTPVGGAWLVLMVVLVTKFADIGAYATGMLMGRHKLIPWLSPGKTWEGVAGGVLCSVVVALVLFQALLHDPTVDWTPANVPLWQVGLLGALLAIGGLIGDLAMSMVKRDAQAKDSGTLLPGMGGVLDVLDSLLITGPLAWALVTLAGG